MSILLTYISHNKTYTEVLNISIIKQILLFFRLFFYNILKSQRCFRSLFLLDTFKVFLGFAPSKKFCRVFQVLKSPQVHKKAQEKYTLIKYLRNQMFDFRIFYLNKLYLSMFLKVLFFSFVIHPQKYFLDNSLKFKLIKTYKLIL